MQDALYIGIALLFFALTWGLVRFCDHLETEREVSALYWFGLVIALLLAVYLFVALFKPEKFSSTMLANGYLQLAFYLVVLTALAKPLGGYMARVYEGKPCGLDRVLGPLERLIYRLCGVRPDEEMTWTTLRRRDAGLQPRRLRWSSTLLQRLQGVLPLEPRAPRRRPPRTWRSTPPSASPPTPTGRATAARRR